MDYGNDYIVEAARAPGWQRHKDAILGISVGNQNQEGPKMEAMISWAARRFERLHVLVADTLQRHNMPFTGAEEISRRAGDLWVERYVPVVEKTGKLKSVVRWDEYLRHEDFPATLDAIRAAAENNLLLAAAIEADIQRFLSRRKEALPDAAEKSRCYLLEELAFFTIYGRVQPGARLYPSKNLESFALIEAGKIPEAPRGMERQQRVALVLRRKQPSPKTTMGHLVYT